VPDTRCRGAGSLWSERLAPLLFASLLAVLAGGCAEIKKFTVAPSVACPGDEVTVTWETNGKTTLSATTAGVELGAEKKSGSRKVTLQEPTNIQIEASRLILPSKASTEASVEMAPGEFAYGVVDADNETAFTCPGSNRTVSATLTLDGSQLSATARIDKLTNQNNRPLVITKGGQTETVAPHEATLAFQGQPAQGEWHLEVPLQEGESCDAVDELLAGRMLLGFQLSCQR
jgi:hypothetical protein